MREYRGGDRGGREYTPSKGSSSAGGEPVRAKTPEEAAADRVSLFRTQAETAASHATKLAGIANLEDWRAEKANVEKRRSELERAAPDREKDAALSPGARSDFEAAKAALHQLAEALQAAKEPRPKPPVAGELEIEPQIKDRSANPNDVLAWAAGLSAGQRHALSERLNQAFTTSTSKDRDEFGIALANYLASARIVSQFRNVLANPRKHFNAAAYAADRAARDASAPTQSSGAAADTASAPDAAQPARADGGHEAPASHQKAARPMGAAAEPHTTADLDGNYEVHAGGTSARIRRAWLREKPIEHWYAVLEAMHAAGAVPWITDDKTPLARFARKLAAGHPMKDEIISFRLDPIAIGIIGLPINAAPVIERIGDDLLIAVPGLGSTGHGETILLDEKHNPERFRFVRNALEAYTRLPIVNADELAAVGASTTTAVMRLHDRELATIFGEAAWEAWKRAKRGAGKNAKPADAPTHEPAPSPTGTPDAADTAGASATTQAAPSSELDPGERARVAAWFAAHGAPAPRALTRGVYQQVAEIEKDPALGAALREYLKRGAGHDRPLDEFALRAAIERARVEIDRARLGLGEFKRDSLQEAFFGPLEEADPFDSATIPARLVQRGLIIAGRSAHFELALDWGAYRGSTDAELANRDWHAVVEWVFERVDVQGPANSDGKPMTAPERFQTEHMSNSIGLDHTFQLGPHEQSGTWVVHAFLHTSHFAPRHVTTTVEVKTETARMQDLRRDAFGELEPANAKTTAHRFDIGAGNDLVKPIDVGRLGGRDPDVDGTITRGELPPDFQARSPEERAANRQAELARTEQLVAYLRSMGEARYADALAAAQRRLEHLRQADADLKKDAASGWHPFELRGTYLGLRPEVPSGPLDLYGSVRREKMRTPIGEVERVFVQIRDHSQKFGPDLPTHSGDGATFEAALEDAFVKLTKEYPEGKVAIMAEVMDASAATPTSTRKAIGFELATSTPWKRFKETVYNPVVQTVVNVAATALMIFQPELAPVLLPILTVSNTVRNVDELVHRYENNTLKSGFLGVTLAQIGLDFMPFMRGAKILQSQSRLVAFEAANQVGQLVVMAMHTRDAIAQIQEADIAALAEQYRELIELQKTTNPSDPELARRQQEIQAGAERIRERVKEEWTKAIAENGIFLVGSHVMIDMQRKMVGGADQPWAPGHLDPIDPAGQQTSRTGPYGARDNDEAAPRSPKRHGDTEHAGRSREDDSSKETLIEDLAAKKALAEQHAHADGSVPVESVLAEPASLSIEQRAKQIADLKKIIDEVAEEVAKAKAAGKEAREPTIHDLRPQKRTEKDGEVRAPAKVVMVTLEGALNQEKGLVNRLYEAKLQLQQEKLKAQPDPKRVALLTDAVDAALLEYRQHLVMRKPDYARYATDVQTGLEFFRRYKMITGHNLTPREIADTRASAGQLAAQELRVGIGGDAMKDIAALKELAREFNTANDEAAWFGDKTDVSLIVNTTKKKSGSPEHAEDMATLIDEWAKDRQLQRAVSGLDNAGVESAKLPPSKLWKMSAKRAFMNAEIIQGELSRLPANQREAFIDSLSRVLGADKATARATLERFEAANFKAAMVAVDAKPAGAAVGVDDHGTVTEAFAGMTMEDAARTTREIVSALRAHRADTGDMQQLPRLLGYTVHAGEQLKDMDPFELLRQVEQAISLGADRIGHGLILGIDANQLQKMGKLPDGRVAEFIARQEQVRDHAKQAGVTIEMNITSNTEISNLTSNEHPTAAMVKSGLKVSVSTDDETTLGTTVKDELRRLASVPATSRTDVAIVILEGFYSRMGVRELPDRARLKTEYKQSLLRGLSADEAQELADALSKRFHTSIVPGNPEATIQRVLDAVFGTGG